MKDKSNFFYLGHIPTLSAPPIGNRHQNRTGSVRHLGGKSLMKDKGKQELEQVGRAFIPEVGVQSMQEGGRSGQEGPHSSEKLWLAQRELHPEQRWPLRGGLCWAVRARPGPPAMLSPTLWPEAAWKESCWTWDPCLEAVAHTHLRRCSPEGVLSLGHHGCRHPSSSASTHSGPPGTSSSGM